MVTCPHCRNPLKAFGHPGIPLYQASKDSYLCSSCVYDQDDSCNYPQRPYAKTCTLYQDVNQPRTSSPQAYQPKSLVSFYQRHALWIWLGGVGLISLGLALVRR